MLPRKLGALFLVFNNLPGSWNRAKWLFIISMKFPINRKPSCLIFEFWDFGRIMAMGHWTKSQNRDSRVFSSSLWNLWSIEYNNHALYWKFETLVGLGGRPQAQMRRPFEGALTCSILIAGTQVMHRKA
jgi:hypothetical protein